jgi:hypothetical protein
MLSPRSATRAQTFLKAVLRVLNAKKFAVEGKRIAREPSGVAGELFRTDQSGAWGAVIENNESRYRAAMNPRNAISVAESATRLIQSARERASLALYRAAWFNLN